MIKTLRLFFVAMLAMMVTNINAGKIVFSELGLDNGTSYKEQSFDGGDFTVVFNGGSNTGKYYNNGTAIRLYKSENGTMTITAKSGKLSKIQIVWGGVYKPSGNDVVSTGTYDNTTGIWTGDAESVVFTCANTESGNWYVQTVASGDDVVTPNIPTEGQTAETAITVARALEIINGLETGKSTDFTYYVKGIATSEVEINYSSATFNIADTAEGTAVLKAYNLKGLGNKDAATGLFKKGDTVVLFGNLLKYEKTDVNPVEIIPEITSGYVVSVNGDTEQKVELIGVAQALELINALDDNATTAAYQVKGFVVGGDPTFDRKTEDNSLYGNTTFTIAAEKNGSNTLTVYRCKFFNNKNFGEDDITALKDGDEVVIQGSLQKYVKDNVTTPELKDSYIVSINGATSGINNMKNEGAKKVIYNLAGQRVKSVQKGLYIINGKKCFVK